MITKILVEIIKRNKMKLKSATTGDNFRLAICFEFILSIFTTVAGSILTSNSNTHIMVFGIVILIYSMGSMISFFSVFFTLNSLWEWNGELTSKYYSTGTILKRDEGYILSFKIGYLGEVIYLIEKNGLVYKSNSISNVGIRNSETMRYTEIENLVNFIKEKQAFPYTEIEEIDLTYKVESPYIEEIREEREASVIVTLPDDFVTELKAFVHKDDDKEYSQHIVN
mgnify:CR=1 FL=1